MVEKIIGSESIQMSYNSLNQLEERVSGEERAAYIYDAMGNLLEQVSNEETLTYTYGAGNMLTCHVLGDGTTQEYTYDAMGLLRAASRTEDGNIQTTSYYFDLTATYPELLYETTVVKNEAGEQKESVSIAHEYGLERTASYSGVKPQDEKVEYLYDAGGSVIREIRHQNNWLYQKQDTKSFAYSPWGVQERYSIVEKDENLFTLESSLAGVLRTSFGYQGEMKEDDGSIYLRARWYEPALERFSQRDRMAGTLTEPGTLNRYLYVVNDAVNYEDPTGLTMAGRSRSGGSSPFTIYPKPIKGVSPITVTKKVKDATDKAAEEIRKIVLNMTNDPELAAIISAMVRAGLSNTMIHDIVSGNTSKGETVSEVVIRNLNQKLAEGKISLDDYMRLFYEVCNSYMKTMPPQNPLESAKSMYLTAEEWDAIRKGELPLTIYNPYEEEVLSLAPDISGSFKRTYYINGKPYQLTTYYVNGLRTTREMQDYMEYSRTNGEYKTEKTEEQKFWGRLILTGITLAAIGGALPGMPIYYPALGITGSGAAGLVQASTTVSGEPVVWGTLFGAWGALLYAGTQGIPSGGQDSNNSKGDGEAESGKKAPEGDTVTSNKGNTYGNKPASNHKTVDKNPGMKGEPNSSVDIKDKNGNVVTRRWYDKDGNATREIHYTNHGNPKQHPEVPHEHLR